MNLHVNFTGVRKNYALPTRGKKDPARFLTNLSQCQQNTDPEIQTRENGME